MITAHEFKIKDEYKSYYADYKRSHKILYTNGEETVAVFKKNAEEVIIEKIPACRIDVNKYHYTECCTVDIIKRERQNGDITTIVKFLVHRTALLQLETRKLKYLQSLQGEHGKLNLIMNIEYHEDVDTHALVTASFIKRKGE